MVANFSKLHDCIMRIPVGLSGGVAGPVGTINAVGDGEAFQIVNSNFSINALLGFSRMINWCEMILSIILCSLFFGTA